MSVRPTGRGRATAGFSILLVLASCSAAAAWTPPAPVLTTPQDSLDPRLSVDARGNAHVVWRERISGGLFHTWYTSNAGGSFAPPETFSHGGAQGAGWPVVCADEHDVHVAWAADLGNWEIYYRRRTSAGWGTIYNASNTAIKSLRPALAARGSTGPLIAWDEALYADDNYDTLFSEWTGARFSPAVNLSNTPGGTVYGSVNVNLAVAPNGDVTAVWADSITGQYRVNARRRVDAVWQARQELSTLPTGPATPGIAVGPDHRVHVVYESQGLVRHHVHDGSAWSPPTALPGGLNSGIRPRITVDEHGTAYVVADAFTDAQNNRDIFHTSNFSGSWSPWANLSATPGTQSLNAEIGCAAGVVTVTWQENSAAQGGSGVYNIWHARGPMLRNSPTGTLSGMVRDQGGAGLAGATVSVGGAYQAVTASDGTYGIAGIYVGTYIASAAKAPYTTQTVTGISVAADSVTTVDFTLSVPAPDPVNTFAAAGGNTANVLTWSNPAGNPFTGTLIRGSTEGYPAGPADGMLIADRPAAPGTDDGVTHAALINGTRWYYAAFAYAGSSGHAYAPGVHASATPAGPGDLDRDGDVDQDDFGMLQACLSGSFVPQTDPACRDARLDGDDDVDSADVQLFVGCVSGPNVPSDPDCLP